MMKEGSTCLFDCPLSVCCQFTMLLFFLNVYQMLPFILPLCYLCGGFLSGQDLNSLVWQLMSSEEYINLIIYLYLCMFTDPSGTSYCNMKKWMGSKQDIIFHLIICLSITINVVKVCPQFGGIAFQSVSSLGFYHEVCGIIPC